MTRIRLEAVTKQLGTTLAVNRASMEIESGELFFLLGPSGCGKSTLLGLVAGLETPDAGHIYFDEREVTRVPTAERNAVLCFQTFALFPHMSVEKNVRFGLEVRRMSPQRQRQRVDEVLALARLEGLRHRKPSELSGGQQQRVALARALAVLPDCLLLDEPLSSLDVQLRYEMRSELRRMCKAAGHTTLYVTHDQKEALSIADRIAVMNAGCIVQVGTARELYEHPRTRFVAEFISHSNVLSGKVHSRGDQLLAHTPAGEVHLPSNCAPTTEHVILAIRPDRLRLAAKASGTAETGISGRVIESSFLGDASEHLVDANGTLLRVTHSPPRFDVPSEVSLSVEPQHVQLLENEP